MVTKLKVLSERSVILLFLLMTACFIWIPEKSILLCPLLFIGLVLGLSRSKRDGHFIVVGGYGDVLIGICTFIPRFLYWMAMRGTLRQIGEVDRIILDSAVTGRYTDILSGFENYPDKTFYFRMFPHKLCYPALLHAIGLRDQDRIILFQIFCAVIAAISICEIGRCLVSDRVGYIAGLLYALWPAQIVYLVFISEENVSIICLLSLMLLIIKAKEKIDKGGDDKRSRVLITGYSVAAGIISGIGACFKDWCMIILIASFLVMLSGPSDRWTDKRRLVFYGIVTLFFRWAVKALIVCRLEHLLQATVNADNLACYLYVSLHPWNAGGYNAARYKEYFDLVTAKGFDFDAANLAAVKLTIKNVIGSVKRIPWLLGYKLQGGYHDDLHMISNAMGSIGDMSKRERCSLFFDRLRSVDYVYWTTIVIGGIYAAIAVLKEMDTKALWLITILTGGLLLILLIECEGRYKYCIQPVWLLCSVWGMDELSGKAEKWRKGPSGRRI